MWPITCFIARAYGREDFIRSCALRILEAETISSARVTLRVFCTLLILVLISLPPAILFNPELGTRDPGLGRARARIVLNHPAPWPGPRGSRSASPRYPARVPALYQLPVVLKSSMPF